MKYNQLSVSKNKSAKRVGRGIAAGQGKTAGRGTKGQNARTGAKHRAGFEGGQNPLMQRLPKLRGFRSHRVAFETVYTGQLEALGKKTVDTTILAEAGIVSNPYVQVKVLVKGELTKPVTVKVQSASAGAVAALENAGGSFEPVTQLGRPANKRDKTEK